MGTKNRTSYRKVFLWTVFLSLSLARIDLGLAEPSGELFFTEVWSVELKSSSSDADGVANAFGFENLGRIFEDDPRFYEFRLKDVSELRPDQEHQLSPQNDLLRHEEVVKIEQQQLNEVVSRGLILTSRQKRELNFIDPMWEESWHLHPTYSIGMNIEGAWNQGFTGRDVTVVHVDNGIDYNHPDLFNAYNPWISYDILNNIDDPFPDDPTKSSHGTNMAGLVAAEANNSVCSVGLAYNARIGMIKIYSGSSGKINDITEAKALSYNNKEVDIYVLGSGPSDRGNLVKGLGTLETLAQKRAAEKGRDGKGIILIYPAGNGGIFKDTCALDGGSNSIYSMSINAVGEKGSLPRYNENCTAIIASAYSSGRYPEKYMVTTKPGGKCTNSFTGTSSSAAVTGGVIALLLEANPNLTWRDVQHLVIRSVRPAHELTSNVEWQTNGAGRMYSRSFGYGLIDADKLVTNAKEWKKVGPQLSCNFSNSDTHPIPVSGSVNSTIQVQCSHGMKYLEHISVEFSAAARKRGDIGLNLISPMGTKSKLLSPRPFDYSPVSFQNWTILSMEEWGENPEGLWTLEAFHGGDTVSSLTKPFLLKGWKLVLFGTSEDPDS